MREFVYEHVSSTNDVARELAAKYPGQVLLVRADRQEQGRGRQGRQWISPVGGVWMTLVWPGQLPLVAQEPVPLLVGLGVLEVVQQMVAAAAGGGKGQVTPVGHGRGHPGRLEIKWPNDVLLNGGKLAGILCERSLSAGIGQMRGAKGNTEPLLIGIGLNANVSMEVIGGNLRYRATSLRAELGMEVDVSELARKIGEHVVGLLEAMEGVGFSADLRRAVEERMAFVGQEVVMNSGGERVMGRCVGLDERGGLMMQTITGRRVLNAGEIEMA